MKTPKPDEDCLHCVLFTQIEAFNRSHPDIDKNDVVQALFQLAAECYVSSEEPNQLPEGCILSEDVSLARSFLTHVSETRKFQFAQSLPDKVIPFRGKKT